MIRKRLTNTKARDVVVLLRERIRTGPWGPGIRIPTKLELSRELGASVGTVQKALDNLTAHGFLRTTAARIVTRWTWRLTGPSWRRATNRRRPRRWRATRLRWCCARAKPSWRSRRARARWNRASASLVARSAGWPMHRCTSRRLRRSQPRGALCTRTRASRWPRSSRRSRRFRRCRPIAPSSPLAKTAPSHGVASWTSRSR